MTRYADPERCPDCLSPIRFGTPRCPSCGLSLHGATASQLFETLSRADSLLATLRAAAAPTGLPAPAVSSTQPSTPVASGAPDSHEPPGGVATLVRQPRTGGSSVDGPAGTAAHGGLGGTSVPKILLGLGALCLLVAALVFLAVAWSAMGVAGRTTTLLGLTAVAGALAGWAARRDLRAAAESMTVVALGLLSFDLFGARNAGWLGWVAWPEFLLLLGGVLLVAGAAAATAVRRTPVGALVSAEVIATLSLVPATTGVASGTWYSWWVGLPLAVVLTGVVAAAAFGLRLRVLGLGAVLLAGFTWVVLAASALGRAVSHPSLEELWGDLEVWPLLMAGVLAAVPAALRRLPLLARVAALGVAAAALAAAVLAPVVDETLTSGILAVAGLLVTASGAMLLLRQPWRRGLMTITVPSALVLLGATASLGATALTRILEQGASVWAGDAGDSFPARATGDAQPASWLLPLIVLALVVALVATARAFPWADRAVAPLVDLDVLLAVVGAVAAMTVALFAVPLWLELAVLLAAAGLFTTRSLRRDDPLPLVLAAAFAVPALQLSLHAEWLTVAVLSAALLGSGLLHFRARSLPVSVVAGALVAGAVAGLVWSVGAVADVPGERTAVVALLLLALLVLGGPYVDQPLRVAGPPDHARIGWETGALAAAAAVTVAGVVAAPEGSTATWAAVYLTLAGGAVSAVALLRPTRRRVGWLGGALLVAASWVRLADLGVDTPEAYTLPCAVALLAVGVWRLRHHQAEPTMVALTPGLALSLLPSLLWVLADPLTFRALVLGLATLTLVVLGAHLRWSAPLVHGALVGTVLVLRLATPWAEAVPRWALIGAAGALLVGMGITWEQRLRDARAVAGYLRSLR